FDENIAQPQWALRNWTTERNIFSDLRNSFTSDWKIFTNCPENSYSIGIDSISLNNPSAYSLKISSTCGDYITVQKKLPIDEFISPEAIRLSCDLYQNLEGEAFRINLFVENNQNEVIAFNRSVPGDIIGSPNLINNFSLQAECIETEVDTVSLGFIFWQNTSGEVLIANLALDLMK
ncbi:MAG: hypothetical protein AAF696_12750, partial [Bacteroidota bacterium]